MPWFGKQKKNKRPALWDTEAAGIDAVSTMKSVLDELDAIIYVTDPDTGELLFMNNSMRRHYGIDEDVSGHICYKVLQKNTDKRCDFCPCHMLDKDPDGVIVWEMADPFTKRIYRKTDRYITWAGGKKVHLQHAVDITDLVRTKEALEHRKNMTSTLSDAATAFLSQREETLDERMSSGLKPFCDELGLDRVALWRNSTKPDGLYSSQIYRWDRESGGTTSPIPRLEDRAYAQFAPRWEGLLLSGEVVNSPVRLLPEASQLEPFGIVSVFVTPVLLGNDFWGFVLYADCDDERYFDDDSADLMRSAALLCANTIIIYEMIQQQRDEGQKLAEMVVGRTEELYRQNSLMSTINTAASILLEPGDDGDLDAINRSMEMVCRSVDADRVYLWQNVLKDDGRLYLTQVCRWTRDEYLISDQLLELTYEDNMPSWEARFSEGNNVNGPVDTLPEIERGTLSALNVQSVLAVPVFLKGALWGFVSFDDCHSRRYFPGADEYTLRSWGLLMLGAFQRNEIMRDLHIKAEEAKQASIDVQNASEAKSRFIANMSHEIRTPMNAILGITEILIQHEGLPADIEEGLDRIYNSCNMLLGIINDILDFSKIEAGKMDINPAQYKVASLINDSIQLNMMRIGDKPIDFEVQVDENVPEKLIGDELRIKQILNNLLSNAFKYTDAGKVVLSVTSEMEETGNEILILSVQDTGHGMSREQLATMFDEYSRFNQEKGKTTEGTGLGLAILVRLVGLMDGGIQVESEPGVGSQFVVRLPQGMVDDRVLGPEVVENLRQFRTSYITHKRRSRLVRDPMPYGKILIVDDVETNLYVAVGLLKPYRLQIDTAMRGQEAIDKVTGGKVYDIIFMDHMMPEMDGIEATKHLRDFGYTGTIVALTANAVVGQADIFLHNGFDDFISKPIDVRQLNSALNRHIRDKQPPEVIEAARLQKTAADQNGADPQADSMLMDSFVRDTQKAIATLEDICQGAWAENEDALKKFIVVVHGMKSSLLNIGEKPLSESALALEKGGRELNIGFITQTVHGFIEELRTLLAKLDLTRAEDGTDEEGLREKLLSVQSMCADYNRKGALDILAEIKGFSNETRTALDSIKAHIYASEFEEAESAAAAYAARLAPADAGPPRISDRAIAGLDIAKGIERYHGDEGAYCRVLRSYAASVRSMLDTIETVSEASLADYKIKVHGIKGASFDIFAQPIGETAKELEARSAAGDFAYITEHNPPFLAAARAFVDDIENTLAAIAAGNQKPQKDKPDAEALTKLAAACKMYDIDGVEEAMAELENYAYESDGGLAEWLRKKVDLMAYAEITEKLSAESGI